MGARYTALSIAFGECFTILSLPMPKGHRPLKNKSGAQRFVK